MPDALSNKCFESLPSFPQSEENKPAPSPVNAAPLWAAPPLSPISTSPSTILGWSPSFVRSSLLAVCPSWCQVEPYPPPSPTQTGPSTLCESPPSSLRSSFSYVRNLPFRQGARPPPPMAASASTLVESALSSIRSSLSASTLASIDMGSSTSGQSSCSSSRSSSLRERPSRKPAGPRPMIKAERMMHRCIALEKLVGNAIRSLSAVPVPGLSGRGKMQRSSVTIPYEGTRAEQPCWRKRKSAERLLKTNKDLATASGPGLRRYSPTPTSFVKELSDASFRDAIHRSGENPVRKFVNGMKGISKATRPTPERNSALSPFSGRPCSYHERFNRRSDFSAPCTLNHGSLPPPYRSTWSCDSGDDDDWDIFYDMVFLRGEALEARLAEISLDRAREEEYLMANTVIGMQWKGDWE